MRIAIALDKEGYVFNGHFAHAQVFRIYEYKGGELREVENRENPLGSVPDLDQEPGCSCHGGSPDAPLHGIEKYAFLREKVLGDVDVVIAGGACNTSYSYFTTQGVRILFAQIVPAGDIERFIREDPGSFEELLKT